MFVPSGVLWGFFDEDSVGVPPGNPCENSCCFATRRKEQNDRMRRIRWFDTDDEPRRIKRTRLCKDSDEEQQEQHAGNTAPVLLR